MSSWPPPAYLKSNGVTRPPFGSGASVPAGTLIQSGGAYAYADFGDWWARSLQAYAAAGVVPDWISLQNEPDFYTPQWETCVFGATEGATVAGIPAAGYGQALDAVAGAIQTAGLASPPVVVGPEPTGSNDNNVQHYLDGLDASKLGGIAHHMYGSTSDNPAPDSFEGAMRDVARSGGRPTAVLTGLSSELMLWRLSDPQPVVVKTFGRSFEQLAWSNDAAKLALVGNSIQDGELVKRVLIYQRDQISARSSALPPPKAAELEHRATKALERVGVRRASLDEWRLTERPIDPMSFEQARARGLTVTQQALLIGSSFGRSSAPGCDVSRAWSIVPRLACAQLGRERRWECRWFLDGRHEGENDGHYTAEPRCHGVGRGTVPDSQEARLRRYGRGLSRGPAGC